MATVFVKRLVCDVSIESQADGFMMNEAMIK